MKESFENFFHNVTDEVRRAAVALALFKLAESLFKLEEVFKGEMGTEARLIWLFASSYPEEFNLMNATIALLDRVTELESRLDNWADSSRNGSPENDEDWVPVRAASEAASNAIQALHAVIDDVRKAAATRQS